MLGGLIVALSANYVWAAVGSWGHPCAYVGTKHALSDSCLLMPCTTLGDKTLEADNQLNTCFYISFLHNYSMRILSPYPLALGPEL